ncbi:MBOAT family O-acyltransferase [Desulfovibrio fairfieldensis]|nr:MBOAT family O-acyltransferase [Desulfovibrio fairfieldensis]
MPFSSPVFLFLFLPLVVLTWHAIHAYSRGRESIGFLLFASLLYYAWWKTDQIWILLTSIAVNYACGQALSMRSRKRKTIFWSGIIYNIASLAFFKYANFIIKNISITTGANISLLEIILPIGISFFTFQQIAYLVDIYNEKYNSKLETFFEYFLIVCFFPYIVSGPIIRHSEIAPQLHLETKSDVYWENIFNALTLLSIGLAKKVLLADNLAPIVHHSFDLTDSLTFLEASFASLAYTLQLYFDFSGYSDMAMACALFFNIRLPWNFLSPYQSTNIQDFWRRWHITLSLWLRDYLYIPLGGSRKGTPRTLCNILVTFLLGGLWHGAAWTFVLWGALHGTALVLHRLWAHVWKRQMPRFCGWLFMFIFLNFAWTAFRVPDFKRFGKFLDAWLGYNGFWFRASWREAAIEASNMPSFHLICLFVLTALWITLCRPNSSQILLKAANYRLWLAVILTSISVFALLIPQTHQEFIYSQF